MKFRPHFYDVDYKTRWVKQHGGIGKDDRFKYQSKEKRLAELSPGPITARPGEIVKLPSIHRHFGCKFSYHCNNEYIASIRNTAIDGSLRDRFKENKKIFYPET